MADEIDVQIDRMTTTISSMVGRLTRSVEKDVSDIKAAYTKLAELFGSKDADAPKVGTAVAKAQAPAAQVASGPVGVQLVKVINGSAEPVPVTVLKEERSAIGGAITTGLGAIGSLVGNFVGGIISGASLPIIIGELIVLVGEVIAATPLIKQILTIADGAIAKIKDIIDKVPIILDLGIRIVLAYLEPVINFAGRFVSSIATLISGYLDWIITVANDLFAKLPPYLNALVAQLVRSALQSAVTYVKDLARSFVDILASALIGAALAMGNVLRAVADYFINGFLEVFSYLGRLLRAPFNPGPAPKLGTFPDLGKEIDKGFRTGAVLGRTLAEKIFGKTPDEEKQQKKDEANAAAGPPTLKLDVPTKPTFEPPVFKAPRDSVLPDLLERTRVKPGDGKPTAAAEPVAPVNFNGGITVNLNVARLDGDNAKATARAIAENILQEVKRMSEVERFRRGLPTGSVG